MKSNGKEKPWNCACPACNSSFAYQGFMMVECINTSCKHYTKKQRDAYTSYCDLLNAELLQRSNELYAATASEKEDVNKDASDGLTFYADPYNFNGTP
jgi:hypothetical protein